MGAEVTYASHLGWGAWRQIYTHMKSASQEDWVWEKIVEKHGELTTPNRNDVSIRFVFERRKSTSDILIAMYADHNPGDKYGRGSSERRKRRVIKIGGVTVKGCDTFRQAFDCLLNELSGAITWEDIRLNTLQQMYAEENER